MEIFSSPSKIRATKYMGTYLAIILFIISFGMGVLTGQTWRFKKQVNDVDGSLTIEKVVNMDRTANYSNSVDFNQFWTVWDRIKQKYVKRPVKDVDMFYGAVQGLVFSLGDPYSLYFPPKAAEEFSKDLSGELEGIGAEIGVKNNQLLVISPLPDSPAERSGMRPGDKILIIDKENTLGMDVGTAVSKIRGKAGTTVVLTINRDGWNKAKEISIVREKIVVPSAALYMKPNDIAYIKVMQFNSETMERLNRFIDQLKAKKAKALILDLRNNPGGYLETAIDMASEWVEQEGAVIVREKGTDGLNREHTTRGAHRLAGMKTIVLVNRGSASASEIVAGALQDYKQATIIGEKTFGKGSVQDYESFPDGSALKLTVAEWYTPNDKNINQEGITPDIEIKEDWDKDKVGEDKGLDKALEILNKK